MDTFSEALLSTKAYKIPEDYDWFAPLIGDWDCDYYDEPEKGQKRHVKGEWIFRRILEGTGIQDVFIFPSRSTWMLMAVLGSSVKRTCALADIPLQSSMSDRKISLHFILIYF